MPFGRIRAGDFGVIKQMKALEKGKRRTAKTVKKKVAKVEKKVRELAPEVKYVSQVWSFLMSNNTFGGANAIIRQAFAVTRGDAVNQRQGAKIMGRTLQIRYNISNGAIVSTPCFYRICLIYDSRPNLALPAIGDIFDSTTLPGPTVVDVSQFNFRNRTYMGRFTFLYDRNGTIGSTGDAAAQDVTGGNIPSLRNDFRNLKAKKKTMYTQLNADGLVTGITDGNYILLAWSSVADGGPATQPLLTINIRYLYTDV